MRFLKLLCLLLFANHVPAAGLRLPKECESPLSVKVTDTRLQQFILYLESLYERRIINEFHLSHFQNELKKGLLTNPISNRSYSSAHHIHFDALEEYIALKFSSHQLELLQNWAQGLVVKHQKNYFERQETAKDLTERISTSFFTVQPGHFSFNQDGTSYDVHITEPFDLASIPITQWQWYQIIGTMPAFHHKGMGSLKLQSGKTILPDHPIEQIDFYSVETFLEKVNALSKESNPLLKKVFTNVEYGDQFRLLTEAEYRLVMSKAKPGVIETQEYDWSQNNSGNESHEVATLPPRKVDGNLFYDLDGNVSTWTSDWSNAEPLKGKNPRRTKKNAIIAKVICGGNFMFFQKAHPSFDSRVPISPSKIVGIRLVRIKQ